MHYFSTWYLLYEISIVSHCNVVECMEYIVAKDLFSDFAWVFNFFPLQTGKGKGKWKALQSEIRNIDCCLSQRYKTFINSTFLFTPVILGPCLCYFNSFGNLTIINEIIDVIKTRINCRIITHISLKDFYSMTWHNPKQPVPLLRFAFDSDKVNPENKLIQFSQFIREEYHVATEFADYYKPSSTVLLP